MKKFNFWLFFSSGIIRFFSFFPSFFIFFFPSSSLASFFLSLSLTVKLYKQLDEEGEWWTGLERERKKIGNRKQTGKIWGRNWNEKIISNISIKLITKIFSFTNFYRDLPKKISEREERKRGERKQIRRRKKNRLKNYQYTDDDRWYSIFIFYFGRIDSKNRRKVIWIKLMNQVS